MKASRATRALALCLGITATLSAAGCSSLVSLFEPHPTTATQEQSGYALPTPAPPTFTNRAAWVRKPLVDAPVEISNWGVLTVTEGVVDRSATRSATEDIDTYSAMLVSAQDGDAKWETNSFFSTTMPRVRMVKIGPQPWAIVVAREKDESFTIRAFNALGPSIVDTYDYHNTLNPSSSVSVKGKNGKAPGVVITDSAILVTKLHDSDAAIFDPASGALTPVEPIVVKGENPGAVVAAFDGSIVVTEFSAGGYAVSSPQGGWTAPTPQGAKREGATVLQANHRLIVSSWQASDSSKFFRVALHRVDSATPLATATVSAEDMAALENIKPRLVVSQDGRTVALGNVIFNMDTKTGEAFDLHGATASAIAQGVLYARGAMSPLSPTESSESPASQSTSTPAPAQFNGDIALDLATKTPLTGTYGMVPIGFSSTGDGIFAPRQAPEEIYSIAVK